MSLISRDFLCAHCGHKSPRLIKRTLDAEEEVITPCEACGKEAKRVKYAAITPNTVTYPDGRKRPEIQKYKDQLAKQKEEKKENK